jgi:hypothetical protein
MLLLSGRHACQKMVSFITHLRWVMKLADDLVTANRSTIDF